MQTIMSTSLACHVSPLGITQCCHKAAGLMRCRPSLQQALGLLGNSRTLKKPAFLLRTTMQRAAVAASATEASRCRPYLCRSSCPQVSCQSSTACHRVNCRRTSKWCDMSSWPLQVEIKLRLPSKEAHDKVAKQLKDVFRETHQQENFFFDGVNGELSSQRVVLRCRFYNHDKRALVTLKVPS